MTTRLECAHAETLAGAIALGEALECERERYRAHLAICARCRHQFGGERQIERVMAVPAQAYETERWEPDLRSALRRRRRASALWKPAALVGAAAIAVFGIQTMRHYPTVTAQRTPVSQSSSEQAERAVAVLNTQTMPRREQRAESLVVAPTLPATRDVTLRLRMNARGVATGCTIAKSSGDGAIDAAVCRAALRVSPVSAKHPY
jgi:hypothetical protein